MPQLQIVSPASQSQLPTASPAAVDGGVGAGLRELGKGFSDLGGYVDQVGKFRGEQAALSADREVQALEIELRSNPNKLLGNEWQEEFDERVSVIQDKYSQTPLINPNTFGTKFSTLVGNRKLSLASDAIKHTLDAGTAAFESNMANNQSLFAKADTPEERALYKQKIKDSAETAVAMGFRTPADAEMDVKEAIENGIVDRFRTMLFTGQSDAAVDWIYENESDLSGDAMADMLKMAFEADAQRMANERSQYRYERTVKREQEAAADQAAMSEFIAAAIGKGMPLNEAKANILPRLSTENGKWLMRFYDSNPSGKLSFSATSDDQATAVQLYAILNGQAPDDPENPLPVRLLREAADGRITASTYGSMSSQYNTKVIDPVVDMLEEAMSNLMLDDNEATYNTESAKTQLREYIRQNPASSTEDRMRTAYSIFKSYDRYKLAGILEGGPMPSFFVKDDRGEFSLEKSMDKAAQERQEGKITLETYEERAARIHAYHKFLIGRSKLSAPGVK